MPEWAATQLGGMLKWRNRALRGTLARPFLNMLPGCGAPAARGQGVAPATIVSHLVWSLSTAANALPGRNEMGVNDRPSSRPTTATAAPSY